MSKPYPTDILKQLKTTLVAWRAIDPNLKFGDFSMERMQAVLERGEALRNQIKTLEIQLADLRNQRDEVYKTGWKYITRLRDGVNGIYGDDSPEYKMVGRKRRSEHKPRSRRMKATSS